MFDKIQNHIKILSSHTQDTVTLERLINLWVDAHDDLKELNRNSIDKVNDMGEFSIILHSFSKIFGEIISNQKENIENIKPKFKNDVLETNQSLHEIEPEIRDICAEIEVLREKRDLLKAKNDELGELQAEQSSLVNEIECLNKSELGELDKLRGDIKKLSKERDSLAIEQKRLTDEKNGLTNTCNERKMENSAFKEAVENLKKAIRDIVAEIARLKEEQAEDEEKYKTLKQDKDALNPEQLRKRYEALLNEARPLLSSWKALKSDPLFTEVFSLKTQNEDIQDELHSLRVEIDGLMRKLDEEIKTHWQKYGTFLAKWEEIFKNNQEGTK